MTAISQLEVRRNISNLYRLLSNLERHIQYSSASLHYTIDSEKFLASIVTAIELTKIYLRERHAQVKKLRHGVVFTGLETDLRLLSGHWVSLHDFVKPATDAHLLNVPNALVQLLINGATRLAGLSGCSIVLLQGNQLGYFKREHLPVIDAIKAIALLINEEAAIAAALPSGLGLIVLPFSSGTQLLQNSLLYHELGEYVYGELGVDAKLRDQVGTNLSREDKEQVVSWCRELFCDLFAIRLVGPVFSFAFADYVELISNWHIDWRKKHPPDDVRLELQIELLKDLGWWDHLKSECSAVCDRLEIECRRNKKTREAIEKKNGSREQFYDLIEFVKKQAEICSNGSGKPELDIDRKWKAVTECFAHGIVPSALVRRPEFASILPITILNAGYFFGRANIDLILDITDRRSTENASDRAFLQTRIEEWAQKAIDDLLVWNYGQRTA